MIPSIVMYSYINRLLFHNVVAFSELFSYSKSEVPEMKKQDAEAEDGEEDDSKSTTGHFKQRRSLGDVEHHRKLLTCRIVASPP